MKKSRLAIFALTVIAILAVIVTFFGDIRDGMRLGLDLKGGFEILYEVMRLTFEVILLRQYNSSNSHDALRQRHGN